jgi:hypothetical protein
MHKSLRSRKTLAAGVVGVAAALAGAVVVAHPAGAIPATQAGCEFGNLTLRPSSGLFPLTSARSVSIGTDQFVKLEAASDVGVTAGAEVRLAWSVNNATPLEGTFGPANFANHQEFFETRSTLGVANVGAGRVTVQPFVKVNGPSTASATLLNRCSTLEAFTS